MSPLMQLRIEWDGWMLGLILAIAAAQLFRAFLAWRRYAGAIEEASDAGTAAGYGQGFEAGETAAQRAQAEAEPKACGLTRGEEFWCVLPLKHEPPCVKERRT